MLAFTLVLAIGVPRLATAGQEERFGDYVVHYSALSTDLLSGAVADQLGVPRSPHQGLVNVTILRDDGGRESPVAGSVQGNAVDLSGRSMRIRFREMKDSGGISWLGTFPVDGSDTFRFELTVTPDGGASHTIVFQQDYVPD
ncbi:MAG: DUF4426 domain-containing protein [Proteobacteria bacterium]|nr:DUF4426 domain-containing protein [Pseudomonadota bacterium]